MDNKVNMLADFAPVSTQVWKDKIIADLKGADFEKKLVWRTPEGFNVQPFYRREDLKGLKTTVSALAHAGIDDGLRIKARLDGAADLIAAGAVDAQAVFPDHLEDARVEIGFDGIMDDIMVALRDRDGTLQRLAQEIDVIQVKRSAVVSQLFRDFAAKHIKFVFD